MKIYHDCKLPRLRFGHLDVSRVDRYWKCPICGEKWEVTHFSSGGREANRLVPAGFKKWRWARKQRKLLRG